MTINNPGFVTFSTSDTSLEGSHLHRMRSLITESTNDESCQSG